MPPLQCRIFVTFTGTAKTNPDSIAMPFRCVCLSIWTLALGFACAQTVAGDWPQILGPSRNGLAPQETLSTAWPGGGPPLLWKRKIGRGYAGIAVRGERAILFYRDNRDRKDEEVIEAVHVTDGRSLWKSGIEAHFAPSIFPVEDGPLCVPLVTENRVFTFGGGGDLAALDLENGRILWNRALYREYRSRGGSIDFGYFGAGSAPILEGNRLLVNVGGKQGTGIVAVDATTGKNIWEATDEGASYSAPVACTLAGERHVIFVTRYHTISIDPQDGHVHFRFPFGRRGPTVNAASPILHDDLLFTTASYGVGSRLTRIHSEGAEKVWANDRGFASQYNTPILHRGYLYGTDGRADLGSASLRCIQMQTGKVMWEVADFGVAAAILADQHLLIIRADGKLILAPAKPDRFIPQAEAQVANGTVRALPALSAGRLFIRDQNQVYCYGVGAAYLQASKPAATGGGGS
jgi:outer membrane protein assembly factor BamB